LRDAFQFERVDAATPSGARGSDRLSEMPRGGHTRYQSSFYNKIGPKCVVAAALQRVRLSGCCGRRRHGGRRAVPASSSIATVRGAVKHKPPLAVAAPSLTSPARGSTGFVQGRDEEMTTAEQRNGCGSAAFPEGPVAAILWFSLIGQWRAADVQRAWRDGLSPREQLVHLFSVPWGLPASDRAYLGPPSYEDP
jgi:hypothetical protein